MNAEIHTLYESDFYRIVDFKCRCTDCLTSKPEYSSSFCISFVRKGNFLFNVFRNSLDSYTGCILVTKPGYERTVTHTHTVPDECTIIDFKNNFYSLLLEKYANGAFFKNTDIHSTLLKATPQLELLHYEILQSIHFRDGKLKTDSLIMEVVQHVLPNLYDYKRDFNINDRIKSRHLFTIEMAKQYITQNYTRDISLSEIATYSLVSSFHFSRIFKTFTSYSPHQFLLELRLKNAEMLLCCSETPVSDIAFLSGFNSIEHFSMAFRKKYNSAPSRFRMMHQQ